MPSLSEITTHLHLPSPQASTLKTPPRSATRVDPSAMPPLTASFGSASYTASPSGRLKLPASAMARTRSGSSSQTPTLGSLAIAPRTAPERRGSHDSLPSGETSKRGSPESAKNSPLPGSDGIGSTGSLPLHKQPIREYVQRYKDVPNLAAIQQQLSFSPDPSATIKAQSQDTGPSANKRTGVNTINGDYDIVETLLEDKTSSTAPSRVASPYPEVQAESGGSKRGRYPLAHPW
jgi:translation initiation factor 4E